MRDIISSNSLFKKICLECGKKYREEDNFCSKHSELIKLVYIKDLVKICPKCGKKYPKDYNYCGIHDEAIKLSYIKDLVKQCPACGSKYPKNYNYCIRCEWDEPLEVIGQPAPPKRDVKIRDIKFKPNKYYNFRSYPNNFVEFDDILSEENINKLNEFNFTQSQFDDIIRNIRLTHKSNFEKLIKEYDIDFNALHILDKMLLFSKCFVKTEYKAGGGDLGHFAFNEIHIDDRLETALQISTIIHELSHFILSEILEQMVSSILNTNKTDLLEGFVYYTLMEDDYNCLIDEYCAHTVEGRFAVLGYQDYGSYKMEVNKFLNENPEDLISIANTIGNTFAVYIKSIMESFINEELREEIKDEFLLLSDLKKYGELKYETNNYFSWDKFSQAIRLILTKNIHGLLSDSQEREKLMEYSKRFKENN